VFAEDDDTLTSTSPPGAPDETYGYIVGYQPPTVYLNEFMADNDTTLEDPDEPGEFPDWIEIYNPGPGTVDLGGMYLTDDLSDPTQFRITDTITVPAGGFLVFYADDDTEQGGLHTNFKLGSDGEEIGLFSAGGTVQIQIDAITFVTQTTDVSKGRCPDGSDTWSFFATATPGASNGTCDTMPPAISDVAHTPALPTASDTVTVTATISDDGTLSNTSLYYRVDGGSFVSVAMTPQGNDTYTAQIPTQPDDSVVEYYVFAEDDDTLTSTSPSGAPDETYGYIVGYQPPTVYLNEFMAD
ncbi:MAG: hypothetical protein GY708_19865, partial [Actinomycetia bacterium]|nr:hypothetical protein [Actinomycetes bacterium]